MKTDYEKLKEQGYNEEEIKFILETNSSSIKITPDPMTPEREDKSVEVTTPDIGTIKSSDIMLGYNKKGIKLPDGTYLETDEVSKALETYMSENKDNKIVICKKTGRKVSSEKVIEDVITLLQGIGKIYVSGKSEKIQNQESAIIEMKENEKLLQKAVLMLGNKGIKLSNGEYVNVEEIQSALNNYLFMEEKKPEEVIFVPKKEEKTVKKTNKKMRLWPIVAAAMLAATIGLSTTRGVDTKTITADYKIEHFTEKEVYETSDQIEERIMSQYTNGEKYQMDSGIDYHESSDYEYGGKNNQSEFGGEYRAAGNYEMDGFSIINNGEIVYVSFDKDENVNEALNRIAEEQGIDKSTLQSMGHFTGEVAGWVGLDNLTKENEKEAQVLCNKVVLDAKYQGTQYEYDGYIEVKKSDGSKITISTIDENGNEIKNGTSVIGSDGKEYRISKLEKKEHSSKTASTWKVEDTALELALATGAIAVIIAGAKDALNKSQSEEEELKSMLDETNMNQNSNTRTL